MDLIGCTLIGSLLCGFCGRDHICCVFWVQWLCSASDLAFHDSSYLLYILTFSTPLLWCFLSPRKGDRDAPFMTEYSIAKYSQYFTSLCSSYHLWSKQTVVLTCEDKHSYLQDDLMDTSWQFSKTIALTSLLGTMTYQVMWKGLSSWI